MVASSFARVVWWVRAWAAAAALAWAAVARAAASARAESWAAERAARLSS
jgi:hypothetical protein